MPASATSQLSLIIKDEVTVEIPVPASAEQTEEASRCIRHYATDGYRLMDAETHSVGQRDPYVVSVRLRFQRDQSVKRTPTSAQCGAELGGVPTCGPASDCPHQLR